jgi:hypothetical protein
VEFKSITGYREISNDNFGDLDGTDNSLNADGNGTLRASLWARNAFDQDYNTFGINFASLGLITEQYGEEASFGLDITYEF